MNKREEGAWIGQRPDANTESIEAQLDDDVERVADHETSAQGRGEDPEDEPRRGHRDGAAGDE